VVRLDPEREAGGLDLVVDEVAEAGPLAVPEVKRSTEADRSRSAGTKIRSQPERSFLAVS
jgi:hypothetical protein